MMAPPAGRTYSLHGFKVAIIVAFIFSLISTLLLPQSVGSVFFDTRESFEDESKMLIGSKPPACVKKCMHCRPCMATVVVPNHHQRKGFKVFSHGEDDSYYLLSWTCRCGDKLFQP